ncbi:hypothetical protein D3C75_980000 [compost metagenome]
MKKPLPMAGVEWDGATGYRLTARLAGALVGLTSTGMDLEVGVKEPSPMLSMATSGLVSG